MIHDWYIVADRDNFARSFNYSSVDQLPEIRVVLHVSDWFTVGGWGKRDEKDDGKEGKGTRKGQMRDSPKAISLLRMHGRHRAVNQLSLHLSSAIRCFPAYRFAFILLFVLHKTLVAPRLRVLSGFSRLAISYICVYHHWDSFRLRSRCNNSCLSESTQRAWFKQANSKRQFLSQFHMAHIFQSKFGKMIIRNKSSSFVIICFLIQFCNKSLLGIKRSWFSQGIFQYSPLSISRI